MTIERVDVADGKYTVLNDNGKLTALRHGQPWNRDLTGDNLVYWLMQEVLRLRSLGAAFDEESERAEFERTISGLPYELSVERYPNDETKYSWPGNYIEHKVELAWDLWAERARRTLLALPSDSDFVRPEDLARAFHETYERLAPAYSYTTREETRTFNPNSQQGQLMIAVAGKIARLFGIAPPASPAVDWARVEARTAKYVEDYDFETDQGSYTPTEGERLMIVDAINGLLADPEFLAALVAAGTPEPGDSRIVAEGLAILDGAHRRALRN